MKTNVIIIIIIMGLALSVAGCAHYEATPVVTPTAIPTPVASTNVTANHTINWDDGTRNIANEDNLTVHYLDVGQGDSELIMHGDENILVDAGEPYEGPTVVADLKKYNVSRLSLIIVTHPHEDHYGGVSYIIQHIPVDTLVDDGMTNVSYGNYDYHPLLAKYNIPYETMRMGDFIDTFSGNLSTINFLWPDNTKYTDLNDDSLVFTVGLGNVMFEFEGDATGIAEKGMLGYNELHQIDILKVGHHGSNQASSNAFLAKTEPAVSIIEVGANNTYGHPGKDALGRLEGFSKVYRTDLNGIITVTTDGNTYTVTASK